MEGGVAPYSSAMAPSGSYILIIVSQPVTEKDKDIILDRLNKGLLSWDVESTGCDLNGLESVCSSITSKHLEDTDVLIQHSTESLGVEVLVNPTVSTLKQCVRNLLSTSTVHKHLIHSGYTFAGSGSWILQNGTFSFDDFLEIFQQADVQSQKRCNIHIHCCEIGLWNSSSFNKDIFAKVANVAFNPSEKTHRVPGSEHLTNCLRKVLSSQDIEEMMEASSLVGNIRFNRPTLYMFPAGQGDCALFGINGFNMLIDGGFNRKPCSWEFIRHLDRLDAVLVTRLCENNVCGMSTLMKRKSVNNTYPQIGYVFCNIPENKAPSPKEETAKDNLVVSVVNEGHNFIQTLNELNLKPHQCWRDLAVEPFVLYHKVGHGTLEMHVLSPPKDSKEMRDFISEWSSFKETFSSTKSAIPLSHATSICAVLIWRPTDPKDTITRILFPGSAPQNKIFESLEKLKTLDVLSRPVVTKASLSVPKTISHKVEKSISRSTLPNRKGTASPAPSVTSIASRNGDAHKNEIKEVKKPLKDAVKKEIKKDVKKDVPLKERKEVKAEGVKKDIAKKDAIPKEIKKEVKKIVKKENKEVKPAAEKKPETKSTTVKKDTTATKTVSDVKKASAAPKKSSTVTKKESKPLSTVKTTEVRKSAPSKISESKSTKEVSNKKISETKTVAKTKPRSTPSTPKSSVPKTTPVAVPKPGSKMTKAVAASSIVAASVAVTAAAFELNEKKEEIIIDETENKDLDLLVEDTKKPDISLDAAEKIDIDQDVIEKREEEVVVSPLPPEALSPTPSESVSLTPSDTLSSAPLETVSPTPPLANEPISTEEKEVNEIKDIEQDMPYETDMIDEGIVDETIDKESEDINDIETQLAKLQQNNDAMSTSFVGGQEVAASEIKAEVAGNVQSSLFDTEIDKKTHEKDNQEIVEKSADKEEGYVFESQGINVDDQLAQMSMEGSFCAGGNYEAEEVEMEANIALNRDIEESHAYTGIETNDQTMHSEKHQEKLKTDEQEVIFSQEQEFKSSDTYSQKIDNTEDMVDKDYLENQEILKDNSNAFPETSDQFKEEYKGFDAKDLTEAQEKQITSEQISGYESNAMHEKRSEHEFYEQYDQEPELEALKETISRATKEDYEISQNIINDDDMQETSVDEPEDIVRKESSVSITLNDEAIEDNYLNQLRRKSGTESEDDVDLQQYMSNKEKDGTDYEKLNTGQEQNSDNEDVVKSPIPHAIVDYEESSKDSQTIDEKAMVSDYREELKSYPSEKHYYDEKDHDSTEEQDLDDEMIRHPTPPEMKYSEDDMKDPIGPHIITVPGLKSQIPGITEQPLYEEGEDEESDRSVSPVVEQPVFGSVVGADFPELVTVSGGTTPSEPQSPKAGYDMKKIGVENDVLEALSEHDVSESSTHSPLCQDGTTFDLPTSPGKQVIEEKFSAHLEDTLEKDSSDVPKSDSSVLNKELVLPSHATRDAQSDDESYSQNEKSETRSEKSDDDDEKSNTRNDDNTDMHDDRSDNQYDGKSDVMDDERRSDIHDDDRTDSHDDKPDYYENKGSGSTQESDKAENFSGEASYENEIQKSYQHSEFSSEYRSNVLEHDEKMEKPYAYDEKSVEDSKHTFQTDYDFHADEGSYLHKGDTNFTQMQSEQLDKSKVDMLEESKVISSGFHSDETRFASDSYSYSDDTQMLQELKKTAEVDSQLNVEQNQLGHSTLQSEQDYKSSVGGDNYEYNQESYNVDNESFKYEQSSKSADAVLKEQDYYMDTKKELDKSYIPQNLDKISDFNEKLESFNKNENTFEENLYKSDNYSETTLVKPPQEYEFSSHASEKSHLCNEKDAFVSEESKSSTSTEAAYAHETFSNGDTFDQRLAGQSPHDLTNVGYESEFTDSSGLKYSGTVTDPVYQYGESSKMYDYEQSGHETKHLESGSTYSDNLDAKYSESYKIGEGVYETREIDTGLNIGGVSLHEKGHEDWSRTSEYSEEGVAKAIPPHIQDSEYSVSHQESNYIINSRFHSDSPEDNVMRSDSSPDVPYPPSSMEQLSSISKTVPETEDFIQTKEENLNINLPHAGDVPISPNKTHNANRDDPYGESSEDDDSSSVRGTVSPYAYTNKAYTREEEDIDGNHIYKETAYENTEVLKHMEFDANNPQNVTAQVAYPQDYQETEYTTGSTNYENFRLEEWEKPMGLPTPPDTTKTVAKKSDKIASKAIGKSAADSNGKAYSPTVASKMSSPLKKPKPKTTKESSASPVYVDLAYVPHHGDPHYCDVEFFKKIRARYYVFSGINPSKEVLNALLEAKKTWKEEMEVTIIPTYETDTLGYWMAQNQDDLATYSIEVAPSASRCTVNLQDHETSCAAYRLEF